MVTATLVKDQIDDGQRLLDELSDQGFPVRAAWLEKLVDVDYWSLCIASPVVDEKGPSEAYRKVIPILQSMKENMLTPSDVKMLGVHDAATKQVVNFLQKYSHRASFHFQPATLGGTEVEDVYVYPMDSVRIPIYGMSFNTPGALHLSFEPHNPTSTFVVDQHEYSAKFQEWLVAAPEGAKLERNELGLMELVWNLYGNRTRSSANEVWSFAKIGLHGFRFLREPD